MSSSSTALPSFDSTEGCLFLSVVFTGILWGVGMTQVFIYYERYGKTDDHWLKIYVFVVWAFDTVHAALLMKAVYTYLVTDIGNPQLLDVFQSSLSDTALFAGMVDFLVQLLFLHRIWILSNRKKVLVACLTVFPLVQLGFAILTFVEESGKQTFEQLRGTLITAQVGTAFVIVAESTLAGTLVILLYRIKSVVRHTNSLIERIIVYVISTGLITSAWSLVGMVFSFYPTSNVYVMVLEVLPKIYFNCMLSSLNLRSSLHEIVPEGGWQGPEAGHISFETSSTNLSTFIVQSTDSSGPTQSIGGKAERSPFQHTNSHPDLSPLSTNHMDSSFSPKFKEATSHTQSTSTINSRGYSPTSAIR